MNDDIIYSDQPYPLGEPAWGIATLFPNQGAWSEEEYLGLDTNHLIEFSNGHLRFLETPKTSHQLIIAYLYRVLFASISPKSLGTLLFSGVKVRIEPGKYREPDMVFMLMEHHFRIGEELWEGADLVMEVVSSDRKHDYETKRIEYAKARIPEYWIVDPTGEKDHGSATRRRTLHRVRRIR